MDRNTKKTLRKFKAAYICPRIVFLAVALALVFTTKSAIVLLISLFAIIFFQSIVLKTVTDKMLRSILLDKLDGVGYQMIIKDKYFRNAMGLRIEAAMCSGDYKTVAAIAMSHLNNSKVKTREKDICLSYLACVYFELRDFDKLRAILEKHDEYKARYPKKRFFNDPNSVWEYYRHFLDGNYEACKALFDPKNAPKKAKDALRKYNNVARIFLFAAVSFESGELDTAKKHFEDIVTNAPRLYLATISEKYIESLESGALPSFYEEEFLPDHKSEAVEKWKLAKVNRRTKVTRIILVICLIGMVIGACGEIYTWRQNEAYRAEAERMFYSALGEQSDTATLIEYFELNTEDEFVDAFCLANIDDKLFLLAVGTPDNGKTHSLWKIGEELKPGTDYYEISPLSLYYIGYRLSEDRPSGRSLYYSLKFKQNDTSYWFYVDRIDKNQDSKLTARKLQFRSKIKDALLMKYDDAILIDNFELNKDGVNINAFCLANVDEELVLLEVGTSDDGKTFNLWEVQKNIDKDTAYYQIAPVTECYIAFRATPYKPTIKPLYYCLEFKYNNTPYWFYIYRIDTNTN